MKIAVAGHPETALNAHFGYAEYFTVFDLDTDPPRFLQTRDTTAHCGASGGDGSQLARSVEVVSDCVAVVASSIGPCARDALSDRDIIAVEHDGPGLHGAGTVLRAIRNHLDPTPHHDTRPPLDAGPPDDTGPSDDTTPPPTSPPFPEGTPTKEPPR